MSLEHLKQVYADFKKWKDKGKKKLVIKSLKIKLLDW